MTKKTKFDIIDSLSLLAFLQAKSRRRCFYVAKLNAKYELMAVYSLANGEDAVKELVEKFKSNS